MINNSSYERWDRLENKSLDQQFLQEIVRGLNAIKDFWRIAPLQP